MIYPFVEIIITTKCNLSCNSCSNLIPEYKIGYDVPTDEVKKSIDALLECVDELTYLKIHGGEPLLAKDFSSILTYASQKDKIKQIIVPTNGSFIPPINNLMALSNNSKAKLVISNYQFCRKNHEALLNKCREFKIAFELSAEKSWYQFGEVKNYFEEYSVVSERFQKCQMRRFPSYYRGKLYSCSRIANGVYLGLVPQNAEEEYDILNSMGEQRIEIFQEFAHKDFCSYCGYCTMNNNRLIKSGEQGK